MHCPAGPGVRGRTGSHPLIREPALEWGRRQGSGGSAQAAAGACLEPCPRTARLARPPAPTSVGALVRRAALSHGREYAARDIEYGL